MKSSELQDKLREYADFLEIRDSMDSVKLEILEALQDEDEENPKTVKEPVKRGRPIINPDKILPAVREWFESAPDPTDLEQARYDIFDDYPNFDEEVLDTCIAQVQEEWKYNDQPDVLGNDWHGDE